MKKNYISEMKQELGITKKKRTRLMESILCDDENYGIDDDFAAEEQDATSDDIVPEKNGDVDNAVNEIRQIALNVIAKLAADPTDEKYQLMKKIWTLCDKTIEDKLNAAKNGAQQIQ